MFFSVLSPSQVIILLIRTAFEFTISCGLSKSHLPSLAVESTPRFCHITLLKLTGSLEALVE